MLSSSEVDAEIRTLEDIFSSPVQLLVPLYQRPYVWEQGKQWEPLWDDVRSVAERLRDHLAAGVAPKKAQTLITPHFMGAVVLQQIHTAIGEMDRFAVIDGQQRLTPLQLLVDAAHAIVAKTGDDERANLLELLVQNTHKVKAETHWPLETDEPEAVRRRNHLLHTLGNLTLVTKRLNPKLSNGSWTDKREGLAAHSVLRVNHGLLASVEGAWTEERVVERSRELATACLAVWRRPAAAT